MNQYQLFIFDMDGVLLDSEPFWRQAQIERLAEHGKTITIDDCIEHTMGKRIDDIAQTWIDRFELNIDTSLFAEQIIATTTQLIRSKAKANDGLNGLIEYLQSTHLRLGLATSSSDSVIEAVLETLGLQDVFEVTLSADHVTNGKPAPDVYLEACRQLQADPKHAIALEDSFTGVSAAVAAGVTTIAIPETTSERFKIAAYIADDLHHVTSIVKTLVNSADC